MNKSTNKESKEREIERDRENRRRRSEVRHERERLRALANRRNMSEDQTKKKQERAPKRARVAAQGLSVSFYIGLHRSAYVQCEMRHSNPVLQPGCIFFGKMLAICAAGRVCLAGSCIANFV